MRKRNPDWKANREIELRKIMHEIGRRRRRNGKQTIQSACQAIAKRLEKKPIRLDETRLYSPSWQRLRAHYAEWRKSPESDSLRLHYKPGRSKISDEFTLYAVDILLNSTSTKEAFREIEEQWEAGFLIPGIGKIPLSGLPGTNKEFPIGLTNWMRRHLEKKERDLIYAIMNCKKMIPKLRDAISTRTQPPQISQ